MDQQNQTRRERAFLPKARLMAVGLVVAALIVAASVLVARALPNASRTANVAHASGGGGGCTSTACVFTFNGHSADASLVAFGSDGCTQTSWSLTVAENVSHVPPAPATPSTSAVVVISQFNVCTSTDQLEASGCAAGVDFQFANLDTASLNTTIPAFDFINNILLSVNVDLAWEGFGGASTEIDSSHFFSPGFMSSSHFIGSMRGAVVTGSFSFGATSFASPDSGSGGGISGNLASTKSASITVSHQQAGAGSNATPFSGGGGC